MSDELKIEEIKDEEVVKAEKKACNVDECKKITGKVVCIVVVFMIVMTCIVFLAKDCIPYCSSEKNNTVQEEIESADSGVETEELTSEEVAE